jgi:hypothetical protein
LAACRAILAVYAAGEAALIVVEGASAFRVEAVAEAIRVVILAIGTSTGMVSADRDPRFGRGQTLHGVSGGLSVATWWRGCAVGGAAIA